MLQFVEFNVLRFTLHTRLFSLMYVYLDREKVAVFTIVAIFVEGIMIGN